MRRRAEHLPTDQDPGFVRDYLEQYGELVDVDAIFDGIRMPKGIVVLFAPLAGGWVAYELREPYSTKLELALRQNGLGLLYGKPFVQ
jgi:hypothetical protein